MSTPTPNPHLALADAAEQRANAATPGPWEQRSDGCTVRSLDSPCRRVCITYFTTTIESEAKQQVDDADFIAHARQDVPALAAAVREQAETIAALEEENVKLRQALIASRKFHIRVIDTIPGATWDAVEDRWETLEALMDKALNSQTRAAVERLKLEAK